MKFIFSATLLLIFSTALTTAQNSASNDYTVKQRFNFNSAGEEIELLLRYLNGKPPVQAIAEVVAGNDTVFTGIPELIPGKDICVIKCKGLKKDETLRVTFSYRNQPALFTTCEIKILPHKPNEVKIDRFTGALLVNGRQFFPFGFYTYSPVHPALPEEEVVKGFNMMSPYQKVTPETLKDRKAYMDRCAALGMKVHYNLLSVSGGGGVNSKLEGVPSDEKRKRLIEEIRTFMDHPALLAWYISDEPNGNKVPPETITEIYNTVKSIDPWHPVSVVFMAPFTPAKQYADGVDIIMADPYPLPDFPASMVGDVTAKLMKEFSGRKPVWIVPQAFGGGELWKREPTYQELRSMTYQAIVNGATGIQYFIRQGLNGFPKSAAAWNECGKMAAEIQSITPWLLSEEPAGTVNSSSANILATARIHNNQLLIIAVNRKNEPVMTNFSAGRYLNGKVEVIFENRKINISGGVFSDYLPPFGSQAYKIRIAESAEAVKQWTGNLQLDPGFEDITSPGVPAACYSRPGADRGATYFTDPREHAEGDYSLRLVTPEDDKGVALRFFPVKVKTGRSYLISIIAKSETDSKTVVAEIGLGDYGKSKFQPGNEWKQFVTSVTIPADSVPEIKANLTLRLTSAGTAWFDLVQIIEDPLTNEK